MLYLGDGLCSYCREVDLLVDILVNLAYQGLCEKERSAGRTNAFRRRTGN